MALNIKNQAAEQLATEISVRTGETKTMVIRRALEERKARIDLHRISHSQRLERLTAFLEREVWPRLNTQPTITKNEREEILGYGKDGV